MRSPAPSSDRKTASVGARAITRLEEAGGAPPHDVAPASSATALHASGTLAALERAAARVRATPSLARTDVSPEAAPELIDGMIEAVRAALDGRMVDLPAGQSLVAARRLLDTVRRLTLEELRTANAAPGAEQVMRLFGAFERVLVELEGDPVFRFADRLTSPDAMQLLVEVAHDMRSPLNAILFLTEQIRSGRSGAVSPLQERQLGLVYSAAFGLGSMASDVIELARGGGSRLVDRSPTRFSVSSLLAGVRDIVQPIAEEKHLTLTMNGPAADVRVGHPVALNRVLLNLTTNALKFTENGSVEVSCVQKERSRIEFSIRDTGRGIPPSVLATLFDAFRQRKKAGDYAFSSAGLGLSICHKIVSALGGELRVDTEIEKGTRFYFEIELPIAPRISNPSW